MHPGLGLRRLRAGVPKQQAPLAACIHPTRPPLAPPPGSGAKPGAWLTDNHVSGQRAAPCA